MPPRLTRRAVIGGGAAGVAALTLGSCSSDSTAYDAAASDLRAPLPDAPTMQDLVRFATLAANGHNTQPWRFRAGASDLTILPDFGRHTPAVDPDDHHLYASLGCAAENLSLAAQARGLSGEVKFDATGDGQAVVDLSTAPVNESALFRAIPARQSSRIAYDGRPASGEQMTRLASAAGRYGVDALMITARKEMEAVQALVIEGNNRQIDDPAFIAELKAWLRFNPDAALRTGDGLYSAASGNPTIPDWLGPIVFELFFTKSGEADKYAEQVSTSAGLVVFVADRDAPAGWFNAGRAYQRFALQATVDGLTSAFLNQTVEVPAQRTELQTLLGLGARRPNLVVRFGRGPVLPYSLRRPVSAVMV